MTAYLRYGILIGAAQGVYLLLEYAAGLHGVHAAAGRYADYGLYLILAVGLVPALRRERDAASRVKAGAAAGLTAAFSGALLFALYLAYVDPAYVDTAIGVEREELSASGMPDEILVERVNGMRLTMGARARTLGMFFLSLGAAAVVTIGASAAVMTRGAPPAPPRGRPVRKDVPPSSA